MICLVKYCQTYLAIIKLNKIKTTQKIMAINFPQNPQPDDVFTANGNTYKFINEKWVYQPNKAKPSIAMSTTPPESPAPGEFWMDSVSGELKVYYPDSDGNQWVICHTNNTILPDHTGINNMFLINNQHNTTWEPLTKTEIATPSVSISGTVATNGLNADYPITLTASPFVSQYIDDSHYSTSWYVKKDNDVVFSSEDDVTNLTSFTIQENTLKPGISYTVHVVYKNSNNWSSSAGHASLKTHILSPTGGNITIGSSRTIHAFTASGIFEVFGDLDVDVLIVGGGGASSINGGGGGGGGVIYTSMTLAKGRYAAMVGGGGNDSSFNSLTALAGGAGGGYYQYGFPGASGGGGGYANYTRTGGIGVIGQGHDGGDQADGLSHSTSGGGGGGGAGGEGGSKTTATPGAGGPGLYFAEFRSYGENGWFGGGGAGGQRNPSSSEYARGGTGGGGDGYSGWSDTIPNTGGGGGAGFASPGASGIIIIRYTI